MKDFLGNELHVGDEVVFINKGVCGGIQLDKGKIIKLTKATATLDTFHIWSEGTHISDLDDWNNHSEEYKEYWRVKVKSQSIYKLNTKN